MKRGLSELLEMPIVQAALLVAGVAAVVGLIAVALGWRP